MTKSTPEANELLSRVADALAERFHPFQQGAIPDESWTLHDAIRTTLGTDPSFGLVAYANHVELRAQVEAAYVRLDEALAEMGVAARAEPWGLSPERTTAEVVELCRRAADLAGGDAPNSVAVVSRPAIPGLRALGKYRGAICCVVAEAAEAADATFGEVIDSVVLPVVGLTDVELLARLEGQTRSASPSAERGADAAATSVSAGKWLGPGRTTMAGYFGAVADVLGPWASCVPLAKALERFDDVNRATSVE